MEQPEISLPNSQAPANCPYQMEGNKIFNFKEVGCYDVLWIHLAK